MKQGLIRPLLFIVWLHASFMAQAQLRLAKIFGDHMVMQRDSPLRLWGWSSPRETISLTFNGGTYASKADKNGAWKITLPKMAPGGPYILTVQSKSASITLADVLIGDVWVCSGQSNMEWSVSNSDDAENEMVSANDPLIRHFKVPLTTSKDPAKDIDGGEWEVTSPTTVGDFTAVGYYFAKTLRQHTDVPIGLLNSSWGGSRLEPWMSRESLDIDSYDDIIAYYENQRKEELQTVYDRIEAKVGTMSTEEVGIIEGQPVWSDPNLNTDDWSKMVVPSIWEEEGYEGLDGSVWFRTTFDLTDAEVTGSVQLSLGTIDDSDITWVNGKQVGSTEMAWDMSRNYDLPRGVLKSGTNSLVVRVEDVMGGGGIYGDPERLFVKTRARSIPLAGEWEFKVGYFLFRWEPFDNQVPTILYNKMIFPIQQFPVKGVIWYQGESNATSNDAYAYRTLFPTMIKQWRQDWNDPNMPFLWVQLANFMATDDQPLESHWAVLRESQSETLSLDHTAQAVIIDIGEADDIHPTNKQDVGYRLALGARNVAYDEDIIFSGPVYRSHEVSGDKIRIAFDHTGGGLVARNKYGYVNGFAIAGKDGKFVWARARISENDVIVWNDEVKYPVAVRYAWGNNPEDANLYNKEGLPAGPFRTDKP